MADSDKKKEMKRRQSVVFKNYETILKTITKSTAKSPLPVKDRRVGARMKKYRQCFLGRDLIRSLIDQQQVTNADEAIHIATELLHSKLIFPTAKTDDSSAILTFSKKQYYSISEDIAITATKNQRAMIKIKSQLRNLEELLIEMKEGFSEVDTTRAADMVAINNYVKSQSKYNRTLLYVLATTIISLTIPKLNLINLDLFHLQSYTDPSIGEYIPYTGWFLVICVTFMFCSWYTKNHSKQISMLSRALGVGAAPKMSLTSSSMHTRSKSTFNSETVEGQKLKLAMDLHKKMVKSIGNSDANDMTTVPMYHEFPGKLTDEADCWSESPGNIFKVRGPNYIKDGLKIHSRACAFKLLHVEFFAVDEGVLVENIAGKDCSFAGKLRKEAELQGKEPPFLFVVCFNFPGFAFACYFQRRSDKTKDPSFDNLWNKFVNQGDDFRDERFKILPGIPPGGANWVVRKTVGSKPAICGRAVEQQWFNSKYYLEANMDVSGSYMATKILGVVKGQTKKLTIDITFIIQGNDITELPERVLCGIRMHKPDLKAMPRWAIEGPKNRSDKED